MITIAAVGDVMIRHRPELLDSDHPVLRRIRAADLSIANLEMALSERGGPSDKLSSLRSHPERAGDIAAMGFQAVSLANNHAFDYGPQAFVDTMDAASQAGLATAGGGHDYAEAVRPAILQAGPYRVALLSFAATLPPGAAAGPGRPGIAPVRVTTRYEIDPRFELEQPGTAPYVRTEVLDQDCRGLLDAVRKARSEADLVLVALHWGLPPMWYAPFQGYLASYQRPLGHAVIDAGADAIIGHHPHVLHGVEVYRNRPILYSLGNFCWHPYRSASDPSPLPDPWVPGYKLHWHQALGISAEDPRKRDSVVAHLCIDEAKIRHVQLEPCLLDPAGEPQPVTGPQAGRILGGIAAMSMQVGTMLRLRDGLAMIPTEEDDSPS